MEQADNEEYWWTHHVALFVLLYSMFSSIFQEISGILFNTCDRWIC